ncbi:asparagine synthetase B family protein [Acidicapsa ligni]|uniref:asparagine synthetase B family protein n=1 Tax=Acidicapsa ligni TaxID=542300 RepID=UPI0021DF8CF7|nr:asparagine synthase-related protein [Acidicapsa ligni]
MNILFGIWRSNGSAIRREELESMAEHTRRFAPDGEWMQITPELGFGVQAQYTHARSRLEVQPNRDEAGNVIIYDGRLDNYRDLAREFHLQAEVTPDSEIILRSYERWGQDCFVRLIGDWALILWDSRMRTLYLARDHAGTRTLHYSRDATGTITWATFLDSYLNTSALNALDPVYIASYLALLPSHGSTPYRDVRVVLPGHFMTATKSGIKTEQFWLPNTEEFGAKSSIEDYKMEFLHLLEQSVERRTLPGAPALIQLSGGMDSTSIVCVADRLRRRHSGSQGPTETLSYFNDSEPTWNERPYFTLVERRLGRAGIHIDASRFRTSFNRPSGVGSRYLYPGIDESTVRNDIELYSVTHANGHRAIISGIGGDEFTGGLANPEAEIAGLLSKGRIFQGFQRMIAWCLDRRISACELSKRTGSYWIRHIFRRSSQQSTTLVPWLTETARHHCLSALAERPIVRFMPFVRSLRACDFNETWWSTLRTQPHLKPSEVYRYEYRYPYLDRDLLAFLLRLPEDELARPGRRRFLMRSALKGIVPEEILERRRKAFLLSSPLSNIRDLTPFIAGAIEKSLLGAEGYVDTSELKTALENIVTGNEILYWGPLLRFVTLETWLQHRENVTREGSSANDFVSATAPITEFPHHGLRQ